MKSNNSKPAKSRHGNIYEYNNDFLERWKNSRFWMIRAVYFVVSAVWTVVMIIGGFIAWLISILFL